MQENGSIRKRRIRRYLPCFVTVLIAVMFLASCEEKEKPHENMVQVYYIASNETGVEIHEQERPTGSVEDQIRTMLRYQKATPENLLYKAPLNMGFDVLNAGFLNAGVYMLNVSEEYLELSGTTEVLVRAAIVRNLTQIDGIDEVLITVNGNQLTDSAGDVIGAMKADEFIHNDGNEINSYEQVHIKLYFANFDGDKLMAASKDKFYSTNMPLEKFIVEELISGPWMAGQYRTINPATKINNVITKDGICYVNLSADFCDSVNYVSPLLAAYSITNSLTELSYINSVMITVNGEAPSVLEANVFERNRDIVTTPEREARRKARQEQEELGDGQDENASVEEEMNDEGQESKSME